MTTTGLRWNLAGPPSIGSTWGVSSVFSSVFCAAQTGLLSLSTRRGVTLQAGESSWLVKDAQVLAPLGDEPFHHLGVLDAPPLARVEMPGL